ncbi:MAG: hypothetical protein II336_16255 [Loktanella sp.]|nr:hypothetical protein [Loktanella sp.]
MKNHSTFRAGCAMSLAIFCCGALSGSARADGSDFVMAEKWPDARAPLEAAIDVASSWPESLADLPNFGSAFTEIMTEADKSIWNALTGDEGWTNRAQSPRILNWTGRGNPPPTAYCRRFGPAALELLELPFPDWMGAFETATDGMELDFLVRLHAEEEWSQIYGARSLSPRAPAGTIAAMDCMFLPQIEFTSQQALYDEIEQIHQEFFVNGWFVPDVLGFGQVSWFSLVDHTSRPGTAFQVMITVDSPELGKRGDDRFQGSFQIQISSWLLNSLG